MNGVLLITAPNIITLNPAKKKNLPDKKSFHIGIIVVGNFKFIR